MKTNREQLECLQAKPGLFTYLQITIYLLGYIMLVQGMLCAAMAKESAVVTCTYDLIADGRDVGDISKTRILEPDDSMHIKTTSEVSVSSWWGSWHLMSSEHTVVDTQGIFRFDHRITEDNKAWRISGERHNKSLWCIMTEVLTEKEQEDEAAVDLATTAVVSTVPHAGLALSAIGLLGAGQDSQGDLRIPLDLFDITATELPAYLLKHQNDLNHKSVRVLDTTELKIRTSLFEEMDHKTLEFAGVVFTCRTFSANDGNEQVNYLIAQDHLGPFMVKVSGRNEDGPYEILLKGYETAE
jgi:hypothetical protein